MPGIKKGTKGQGLTNQGEIIVPFTCTKMQTFTPHDTNMIPEAFQGGVLFVNSDKFQKFAVNCSLVDNPTSYITLYLDPGYHPIHVFHIKATGTDTTDVTYVMMV